MSTPPEKYLVVNADDFGYSFSVNRGIIKAHEDGIVTSTSVMVDCIGGEEAAGLSDYPNLSVGLHLVLSSTDEVESELARQVERFKAITGKKPDHIDTHKQLPSADEHVKQVLTTYAREHRTPVRSLGFAKFINSFFGLNIDGSGTLSPENVSLASLERAIDEATDEFNELMCHAGYSDDYLRGTSSYNDIRGAELKALTDPGLKGHIGRLGLTLCNWRLVSERVF